MASVRSSANINPGRTIRIVAVSSGTTSILSVPNADLVDHVEVFVEPRHWVFQQEAPELKYGVELVTDLEVIGK